MNKNLDLEKILIELGFKKPKELSPQEEEMFKRAIDPEYEFLYDVEQLFNKNDKT